MFTFLICLAGVLFLVFVVMILMAIVDSILKESKCYKCPLKWVCLYNDYPNPQRSLMCPLKNNDKAGDKANDKVEEDNV